MALPGADVVRMLIKGVKAKPRPARATLAEYQSQGGKVMLSATRQGRSGLVLRLHPNSGASHDEIGGSMCTGDSRICVELSGDNYYPKQLSIIIDSRYCLGLV